MNLVSSITSKLRYNVSMNHVQLNLGYFLLIIVQNVFLESLTISHNVENLTRSQYSWRAVHAMLNLLYLIKCCVILMECFISFCLICYCILYKCMKLFKIKFVECINYKIPYVPRYV